MRAALYARVSTLDQAPENQLTELRDYVDASGWAAQEYVDPKSGLHHRRPPRGRPWMARPVLGDGCAYRKSCPPCVH